MPSYTIGRSGDQTFEIPQTLTRVHGEHARIDVSDDGVWRIKDLKPLKEGNGVYVRNENGDFRRVSSAQIKPTDMIRLGPQGPHSFTFMAHRVLNSPDNPNPFAYEFRYMRHLHGKLKAEEEQREALNLKHSKIAKWAPLAGFAVSMLIPGSSTLAMMGMRLAILAPGLIVGQLFFKDPQKLKAIRQKRQKLVVCPNCGRPLSDYDITNLRCSACRAL